MREVNSASETEKDRRGEMALYLTIHLHNVPGGREPGYQAWFDGPHQQALGQLRAFRRADRYELADAQVMADIVQPWRFCSLYDFETDAPALDVPSLGPLLSQARDTGLIFADETERLFTFELYSDWVGGPNWRRDEPLSGISILIGNYIAGRYDEYMRWYDEVHCPEVIHVPGHVAMRRGKLSPHQVEPRNYCPGDQLVCTAAQTDNLHFTVRDFALRASGQSPSGVSFAPRSKAGSSARTVHYFNKISGARSWRGGIAYAGDLTVYPEDYGRPWP